MALNTHCVGCLFTNQKPYTYYELVWYRKTEYQEREGGKGFSVSYEEENQILKLATLAKFSDHTKKMLT